MNKCPRCENENLKEDYNYCPVCGVNLGTAPEVPVQEQPKFIPEDSNGKYSLTEKSKKCVF